MNVNKSIYYIGTIAFTSSTGYATYRLFFTNFSPTQFSYARYIIGISLALVLIGAYNRGRDSVTGKRKPLLLLIYGLFIDIALVFLQLDYPINLLALVVSIFFALISLLILLKNRSNSRQQDSKTPIGHENH